MYTIVSVDFRCVNDNILNTASNAKLEVTGKRIRYIYGNWESGILIRHLIYLMFVIIAVNVMSIRLPVQVLTVTLWTLVAKKSNLIEDKAVLKWMLILYCSTSSLVISRAIYTSTLKLQYFIICVELRLCSNFTFGQIEHKINLAHSLRNQTERVN